MYVHAGRVCVCGGGAHASERKILYILINFARYTCSHKWIVYRLLHTITLQSIFFFNKE